MKKINKIIKKQTKKRIFKYSKYKPKNKKINKQEQMKKNLKNLSIIIIIKTCIYQQFHDYLKKQDYLIIFQY